MSAIASRKRLFRRSSALAAEEFADLEAERALDEQLRAEEQTAIAESERERAEGEQVRAERAAMCSAYSELIEIERLRFLPIAQLYERDQPADMGSYEAVDVIEASIGGLCSEVGL